MFGTGDYVLAAIVAEEATGKPWEDLVATRIAAPLGLTSLGFGPPENEGAPWGHRGFPGFKRPADPDGSEPADNPVWMGPAGWLHMNLNDLIIWGQAHLQACKGASPAFLSQQNCQRMKTANTQEYGYAG